MSDTLTRRDFGKKAGAVIGAAIAAKLVGAETPVVHTPKSTRPVVIASANGHEFKNGGPRTCVEEAFMRITRGDDVLESLIAGVNIVELDPEEDSVGYGGLPNADGVVQLDASCMHGPKHLAGGVAAIEGVRTPSVVAKAVMENTDHILLVGSGAQTFARNMGFTIEEDLNTEHSRKLWLEWKRRIDPKHYLDPAKRSAELYRTGLQMVVEGLIDPRHLWGTINCDGVNAKGDLAGATTTSGLAWKIPGRVGDSPIIGAGLYVDNDAGAAGSTGRGEANLYNLSSFLIVENMRRGMHPKDAGIDALRRVKANTVEKRLQNGQGDPAFGLSFYILSRTGEHAGVCMYGSYGGKPVQYAVCTENGPQLLACDGLLGDAPENW